MEYTKARYRTALAFAFGSVFALASLALAETYPAQSTIRFVAPTSPGHRRTSSDG